jgi:hypothetical protein
MKKMILLLIGFSVLFTSCQTTASFDGEHSQETLDRWDDTVKPPFTGFEITEKVTIPATEEGTDDPTLPAFVTVNQNPAGAPSSNPSKISGIEPNDGGFGMSFTCSKGSFTRGEVMLLDITLINNTGKTYAWTGSSSVFHPTNVKLWCVKEDGSKYSIPHRSLPDTEDICYNEVKNGESYTRTYVFDIPEDAPAGDYTLTCSFQATKENGGRKDTIIFEGYFRLEE